MIVGMLISSTQKKRTIFSLCHMHQLASQKFDQTNHLQKRGKNEFPNNWGLGFLEMRPLKMCRKSGCWLPCLLGACVGTRWASLSRKVMHAVSLLGLHHQRGRSFYALAGKVEQKGHSEHAKLFREIKWERCRKRGKWWETDRKKYGVRENLYQIAA